MLKESEQEQERNQKEETNFEKMDKNILILQNKSLFNELQRIQAELQSNSWTSQQLTSKEETKTNAYRHSLIYLCDQIVNQIESLQDYPKFNQSLLQNLVIVFQFVKNTCLNMQHQSSESIREFLTQIQLAKFFQEFIDFKSYDSQKDSYKLLQLSQQNQELREQVARLNQLNLTPLETLQEEIKDLKWENLILQKRISFQNHYQQDQIEELVSNFPQKEVFYCYCGGKAFEVFNDKYNLVEKIEHVIKQQKQKQQIQEQKVQENDQVDSKQLEMFKEKMAKELKNLLELAESRRVDKNTLTEKLYKTKLFSQLEGQFNQFQNYIEILEKRSKDAMSIVQNLQSKRRQEIIEFQYQCKQNTNQLTQQIETLKNQNEIKDKQIQQMKKTNENYQQIYGNRKQGDTEIQKKLNQSVNGLSENLKKCSLKNEELEKKLSTLNKKYINLEQHKFGSEQIQNQEFRHRYVKQQFEKIKILINQESMIKEIEDLEGYVKSREKKIYRLEQTIKHNEKSLENEKQNSNALLDEMSNSAETFGMMVQEKENLQSDLDLLNTNLVEILKEKNHLDIQISQIQQRDEEIISKLKQENNALKIEMGNGKDQVQQLNHDLGLFQKKSSELQYYIDSQIGENDSLKERLIQYETSLNLVKKKNLALQDSNQKLQNEVSQNLTNLTEKDIIIKSILKDQVHLQDQNGELTLDQKKQYYMTQMELERLRKIIVCKACNDREKEVILTTCYHSFCQSCVDKNFKERSRQCPICLVKMSKYDIKKIYLDQLIFKKEINLIGFFQQLKMTEVGEFFLLERLLQDRQESLNDDKEVKQQE